jgi:molybdopterin biosynthesis enzyme MoaB
MLPNTSTDLTPEQVSQIEQAKKVIPGLKAEIRRAKLAGIDVTAQETNLAQLEAQLTKLYNVYVRKSLTNIQP